MPFHPNRRQVVQSLMSGSLLLPGIASELLAADAPAPGKDDPLAPKAPHFPGKAKRVIFLFMTGGVSHLESFDPKPLLARDGGTQYQGRTLLAPQFRFSRAGQSGIPVSELFPHVSTCVDDLCVIRSLHGSHFEHFQATLGVHTGSLTVKRPSIGSWVSYGLGTENQNLPSFVVLAPHLPYAGTQVWSSDFLPVCHQGTRIQPGDEPIRDLRRRAPSATVQELELDLLSRFNRRHGQDRPSDPLLAGRMRSFETAFGMQQAMPDVLDLSGESDATLALYGLERGQTDGFGWQCLVARRMSERGVRFVELIDSGSSDNWDSHGAMKDHVPKARGVDQAIAGLLKDLKSRGMLDETLVVWTTEFGRTPHTDGPTGRSHHPYVFSSWLAGGGVKGGMVYGSSDDYGYDPAENPVHLHDFHATILHLLGFDHERLTYRHSGRDFRLTDVFGRVVREILA
ncbi:DUF1501 domain-containing protein [Tautonia rosea]|uniref:DUF1501 domain-containing protein n=1 Tax=Tautonia rosea TaxID=2728037 RepID=UPI00147652A4|nr:DUF1501 domain-containing protein [Tautonia rosea]